MTTFNNLIEQVIRRLSMVGGTGTQIYSEDLIGDMIQHKFDVLFDETFWPQFSFWNTYTLDGTLGVVTADLTDVIKRFDDIGKIYIENSETLVTELPETTNPMLLDGNTPVHYGPLYSNTAKVFHVWPKSATGNIVLFGRTKPDAYTGDEEVDFDDQALILGATYDYLEDDGANPGATQKFQSMFEARVNQLKNNRRSRVVPLVPGRRGTYPQQFTLQR